MTYILQQKESLDQSNEHVSKGLNMLPRRPERPLCDKIYSLLQKHALQATLLDPETDIDTLVHKAELTVEQGTDLLLMGGSSHVSPVTFFKGMEAVKKVIKNTPLIIYNANFEMISDAADGMLYGSVLNSKDMFYVINNSINAAPLFRKTNVEPLATAFLIFEPGMTVGYMLNCHLLPQNNIKIPVAYAMTAENLGYSFIYLEAGSRAPQPISPKVIRAIRENIRIGIMVGGGIVTKEKAKEAVEAGGDIIIIGTHFERNESIHDIIDVIHSTQRYNPKV